MKRSPPQHERLVFDGALTARNIGVAHARLSQALHQRASVEIDCAGATEIDLSFAQLLLSARRTAAKTGKSLVLAPSSATVLHDVLARAGLLPAVDSAPSDDAAFWLKGPDPK
jgi:ABC-type transporter Mla MlaB component